MAETYLPKQDAHPTTSQRAPSVWLLLVGPIAWSVYHVIGYLLVETACRMGLLAQPVAGVPALVLTEAVLALLALIPTLYAGWSGLSLARQGTAGEDRAYLFGLVAVTFNLILTLIILADGISAFVLRPCG